MVAAWGGYLFVLNMIGAHALALVLLGRFSRKLWRAYSLWFVSGTAGAPRRTQPPRASPPLCRPHTPTHTRPHHPPTPPRGGARACSGRRTPAEDRTNDEAALLLPLIPATR